MKWFYNLKISNKLILSFIVVAIIAGVVGFLGISNIHTVADRDTKLYQRITLPIEYLSEISTSFHRMRVDLWNMVYQNDPEKIENVVGLLKVRQQTIAAAETKYKASIAIDDQVANTTFQEFDAALNTMEITITKIIDLAKTNRDSEAYYLLANQADKERAAVQNALEKMTTAKVAEAKQQSELNNSTADNATTMMLTFIFIAVLVAITLGIFIAGIISKPLKRGVKMLQAMNKGHLDTRLRIDSQDEIGVLAQTMDEFADDLQNEVVGTMQKIAAGDISMEISVKDSQDQIRPALKQMVESLRLLISEVNLLIEAAVNGKLDIRADVTQHKGDYQKIVAGINKTLDAFIEPITEAKAVLGKLAVNDYSLDMTGSYEGEFKSFAEAIVAIKNRFINLQDLYIRLSKGDTSRLEEFQKIGRRSENDILMPSAIGVMHAIRDLIKEAGMLADAATKGELEVRGDTSKFEGGYREIISGFNAALDAIAAPIVEASEVLQEMANGDLCSNMQGEYQGSYAVIKYAMNQTIQSFNEILGGISEAAEQVAVGARQISDSSQGLSQGAAEQASTVEEMNASLSEIATQTKQNAANANQANELSQAVKDNATDGNEQMKRMLNAMDEINIASNSISKIIKVIDEIAFQTNILALNAAVEAARAGQHGKGFAVVAEEVRNLAARSADAAHETTTMIEGSIRKVDEGTRIAKDTAVALDKIVSGVGKANHLIGEIAVASNEQATGIAQVNLGIAQVAQVTQTSSATAQEGAASSEELLGQAELLQTMVGQFKIKNGNKQLTQELATKNFHAAAITKTLNPGTTKNRKSKISLEDNDFAKY